MAARSRYWCFTEHTYPQALAPILFLEGLPPGITYLCGQLERGEQHDKTHFQGYVELEAHQRVTWLKRNLSHTAHFEVRRGTQEEAIGYTQKEDTSSGTAFNQFQNTAFFGRFRVLKDKRFVLQNPTLTWDGTNLEQSGIGRQFKINFKFRKPMMVRYNATNGGTVADVIDNSFHLIGGTLGTTLQLAYAYSCRVVYTDP